MRRYRPDTEPRDARPTGSRSDEVQTDEGRQPMSDTRSPSPALSDDELRETIELFSTVLASVSDRVDDQTKALDRINKTATEARQAAFAAREQTDPQRYADLAARLMDDRSAEIMGRTNEAADNLTRAANHTARVLTEAESDRKAAHQELWMREGKLERSKRFLPWFALGAAVLALAMSVALPRFLADYPATCAVIGGVWTSTTTGIDACVFYHP